MDERKLNITEEDFDLLIGNMHDSLSIFTRCLCSYLPQNSKYFIGNGNKRGKFWNGFSIDNLPCNRCKMFLKDEVYKEKSKYNLTEKFLEIIQHNIFEDEEPSIGKIMSVHSDLREVLIKMFNIEVDGNTDKLLEDIDNKYNEFQEKINETIERDSKIIESLKTNIDKAYELNNELKKKIKDLEEENKLLAAKDDYKDKYDLLLNEYNNLKIERNKLKNNKDTDLLSKLDALANARFTNLNKYRNIDINNFNINNYLLNSNYNNVKLINDKDYTSLLETYLYDYVVVSLFKGDENER